jgi:hypothetical protein
MVDTNTANKEKSVEETLAEFKISNINVEKFLEENGDDDEKAKNKPKKQITCTKCRDSKFDTQDDLRKHYKTNWHTFNAKLSAQNKESLSAEEYDEYVLMNPNVIQ